MRRPAPNNLDRALLAIWALVALPVIVLNGWLKGMPLPPLWSGSPLLVDRLYDGAWLSFVYGLPVVIAARVVARALR